MPFETSAPPFVTQLRVQLGLCSTWSGLVGSANALDRVHYPSFNPGGVRGALDRLPAVLLLRPQFGRKKWIEGASGLANGSLGMMFYFPALASAAVLAAYGAGRVEALVESICGELIAQRSGIPFRDDATIAEASDPTEAAIASNTDDQPAAFRTCQATIPYGYST